MRRIWDTLGAIAITAMLIYMLMQMVRPYVPFVIIGIIVVVIGKYSIARYREW